MRPQASSPPPRCTGSTIPALAPPSVNVSRRCTASCAATLPGPPPMRSKKSSRPEQLGLVWDMPGLVAGVDEAGRGPLAGPVGAAASILAKVHRDRLCLQLDALHPHYGFAAHKGYATPEHLAALREHGACPLHRRSFAPVREVLGL